MTTQTLTTIVAAQDAEALENWLFEGDTPVLPADAAPMADALLGHWHEYHEDLTTELQRLRDPGTASALFTAATATYAYRHWDDGQAISRRCTWALADIGTTEAKRLLTQLAANPDEVLAGFAAKRLGGWEQELARKRGDAE